VEPNIYTSGLSRATVNSDQSNIISAEKKQNLIILIQTIPKIHKRDVQIHQNTLVRNTQSQIPTFPTQ
jgi:hypothetical protein